MGRRLLAIASMISLLLCAALVTMWVRSYRSCVEVVGTGWIKSWEGEIEYVKMVELSAPVDFSEHGNMGAELTPEPRKPLEVHVHAVGKTMIEPGAFGFGYGHGTNFYTGEEQFHESVWDCYLVPYWLFVAITAVLPVAWVESGRWRRRRARKAVTALPPLAESQPSTNPER